MRLRSCRSFVFAAVLLSAVLTGASGLHAESRPVWSNHSAQAFAKAKAEKKLVLMSFTGSDWCSWCLVMDREIFNTPEFKDYAKDHLVLLELDFPQLKPIAVQTLLQNQKLALEYGVEVFPTQIVLNSDGKPLKMFTGYQPRSAAAFVAELRKLKS